MNDALDAGRAKRLGRAAGLLYLVIIAGAGFAQGAVREPLVLAGDPGATAANVSAALDLFRLGFATDLLAFMADAGVAVLFYVLLREVDQTLALLAAAFRLLAHPAIAAVNLLNHYAAILLLDPSTRPASVPSGQVDQFAYLALELHGVGYLIGGAFFGVSLLLLGWLMIGSARFPSWMGVLLMVAGVTYLAESFTYLLDSGFASLAAGAVVVAASIAELTLCVWLLIRGARSVRPVPAVVAVLAALAAVSPTAASAQEEGGEYVMIANEYFLTEAVYPQEAREVQLTLLPTFDFEDGSTSLYGFAMEYGFTDRLQIEVAWDAWGSLRPDGLASTSGSGDVELEARYTLMNVAGSATHLAVGFGVTLPAGDEADGFSEGAREYEPSVVLARDFLVAGRPAQLFTQASLGFVDAEAGEEEANELFLGGGLAIGLGTTRLILEGAWASNEWDDGDESEVQLSSGLVWDLPGSWEAGVATRFGVGGEAADFGLSFIVLYEFEFGDDD